MNSVNTDINLKFQGFDFNREDMKFLSRQLASAYGENVRKLMDELLWWGKECAANPSHEVNYTVVAVVKSDHASMATEKYQVNIKGEDLPFSLLAVSVCTNIDEPAGDELESQLVSNTDLTCLFDRAYESAKTSLARDAYQNNYHSLRSKVVTMGELAEKIYVAPGSIRLIVKEGENKHTIKLTCVHLDFMNDLNGIAFVDQPTLPPAV